MQDINLRAVTTDTLRYPALLENTIAASMLRLDKIHPLISGNKWFKLRFYLEDAKKQYKKRIVTFGGAWSNHIIATAAACRLNQFACTGVIRGEQPPVLSDTLNEAQAMGMQLVFTSREEYARQHLPAELNNGENYIIQQGGFGEHGARGAADMLQYCAGRDAYTHICCASGTGTMMAGLLRSAQPWQQVIGISVLKNNFQLEEDVKKLSGMDTDRFRIIHDYHCTGYARYNTALIDFMNEWYGLTGIPTDFVYTGKLCFAITSLVKKEFFPRGSRLLFIHSGGLTGNASLKKGTLIF